MGIAGLVVAVDHHDLGPGPPDHRHQPLDRLVEGSLGEALGIGVGLGTGHARIAIAQHDDLVVADDRGGLGQFLPAQVGDPGVDLGGVQGRVEDLTLLAPGAAHQHGLDPLGVVQGHRPRALGRFVVRMGMNSQEAE